MKRAHARARAGALALLAAGALLGTPPASGETVIERPVGVFDIIVPRNLGARLARDVVTLLVGAPDDAPGAGTAGVVYAFTLTSTGASQQARLEPADGEADDHFGTAVDLSIDLAAIGADREDDNGQDAGAVYVFLRTGSSWAAEEKILAADGDTQDRFGAAVAIDGNTLAIGAPGDDDVANNAGAVYVFTREAGPTWVLDQKIASDTPLANNGFGAALALEDGVLVIGAPTQTSAPSTNAGAVYVFTRATGAWTEQTRLLPSNTQNEQAFGTSLGFDDDTLVVGAPGENAAYLYTKNGAAWSQPIRFVAGDGAAESGSFGDSVAVDGTRVLVGDSGADVNGPATGQAHLFDVDGDSVTQQRLLRTSIGAASDRLGASVELFGQSLYVGAPQESGAAGGGLFRFGLEGPADAVRSFIAPSRVVVTLPAARRGRRLGMTAAGVLDTGADAVDLTLPGTLRVGSRVFPAPNGLAPRRGRTHVLDTGIGFFRVTPPRNGSSRASFVLRLNDDLTNDVVDEGEVPLRYTTSEFDAVGTVEVRNGAYRQRRLPGSVVAPAIDVRRARATLRGGGRDLFSLVLGFDTNGQTPATAPDVTVCLGRSFTEEIASETFRGHPRGDRHQVLRRGSGVFQAVLNYARGTITVKGRNVNLGVFDDGPVPLFVFVRLDGVIRSAEVLAFRKGRVLRY